MTTTPLTFIATNDLSAQTRGRSVPGAETPAALRRGVGWVPANLAIGAFGHIAEDNVFGATGDLRLMPDNEALFNIAESEERPGLSYYLADQTRPDGSPWACCPRTFARDALREFTELTGLEVVASFEHEFFLSGAEETAPFSFERFRKAEPFGSKLVELLDEVGLRPETWLPEYGEDQFEITLEPTGALAAADRAVVLRDLVRDLAERSGRKASFAPLLDPDGSGSGVHIHFSLRDAQTGAPVLHDPERPSDLAEVGAQFAAGIITHAKPLTALTACSPASYLRLSPNRWSVGGAFLGEYHREALVRICPTSTLGGGRPQHQFNLEYRAADATANPWLAVGAIVRAGMEGIKRGYQPEKIWHEEDSAEELTRVPKLPTDVEDALDALRKDDVVMSWFHPDLIQTYVDVKRADLESCEGLTAKEICRKVANVY
ncbi:MULTISPECIES: glutamine synthetase family protein [Kocuria]|uniref:glutamine synthetase family protein n=1 Tax=Kocuria TaxID=57493 RepID=UPI0006611EEC|nr:MULTISPECIES: glutamine synthetase family protein [Kocuria]RUQ20872.1 glutamine synthetase [Kocuria sp. HSID16901]